MCWFPLYHKSESVMHTHISPLFWVSFPFRSPESTEFPELHSRFSLVIYFIHSTNSIWGFPDSSVGEESACNAGVTGSIPRSGRSPGEGNGNLLQNSCLGHPMDRGALWATVHGVAKRQDGATEHTHYIIVCSYIYIYI